MNRFLTGQITKSPKDSEYDATFVISSSARDRDGDIVLQDGWDTSNFERNPIALWMHDKTGIVGSWHNIRRVGEQTIADLKLASTNLARMAKQLIDDGALRAVSVGFLPKEYEPIDEGGWLIRTAELLEVSLVSVPANQEALMISKQLGLSDHERALIFADPTVPKSADLEVIKKAKALISKSAADPTPKGTPTMNLAEQIVARQNDLTALREKLGEATAAYAEEPTDEKQDEVESFTSAIESVNNQLETLKRAECAIKAQIADGVAPAKPQAPAVVHSVKNYAEGELFFKQATCVALSHVLKETVETVRQRLYRNDKGLEAIMTKADSVPATTTGTNWAAPLLEESTEGFVDLFTNNSVYGALRANAGATLNFAGKGSIKIPNRGSTKKPAGGFVGEGAPIPVKEAYFGSQTLTPDKMAVIVPFAEELVEATSNQIEAVIRAAIIQDTAEALDTVLLDSNAASASRPAGLLNGVTLTNSAGDTAANITTDVKTLLANFVSTDTPKRVWLIMNGARKLGAQTVTTTVGERAFPEVAAGNLLGYPIIESGNCPAAEVYSINSEAFYTAYDAPRFAMSNTAVLHMEDTSPLEIVSGTGPTTADPVRSLFQTDTLAIRMILPVTWALVRASQVDGIDTVSW